MKRFTFFLLLALFGGFPWLQAVGAEPQKWLVDAQATNTARHTFRDLRQALLEAETLYLRGEITEERPLVIDIAPSVYWLDNPDEPTVKRPLRGENIPFGMKLKFSHVRLRGLTDNPEEVVLACNRGQTMGAEGNFTCLYIEGDDIQVENLTFGNYCNVDLDYPFNPSLSRKKRGDAIVQAQLIICKGDKYVARKCRFISRLNLCPFAGAKRVLFDDCYFECTDDALCGTGVYHRCRFTLFSGKPFYRTSGTGAVFLNCDLHSLTSGRQYLTKVGSPVTMIDCRWTSSDENLFIGWTQDPTDDERCYQANLSLNGNPLVIQKDKPWLTVDLTGRPVLDSIRKVCPKSAFSESDNTVDTVVYDLQNLLGFDVTDVVGSQKGVWSERRTPFFLSLSAHKAEIETDVDTLFLESRLLCAFEELTDTPLCRKPEIKWSVRPQDAPFVCISPAEGGRCVLKGRNKTEQVHTVWLQAEDVQSGLQAVCVVDVKPRQLPPPVFIKKPIIRKDGKLLTVDYQLDLDGREDESQIVWYRHVLPDQTNGTAVAVSRPGRPLKHYELSVADHGCYIRAEVIPKHLRSDYGTAVSAMTKRPVRLKKKQQNQESFQTDFSHFPGVRQTEIKPGYWVVDSYKPMDVAAYEWEVDTLQSPWFYETGVDGAAGVSGLIQGVRGARLMYTPVPASYGDMEVELEVAPCKSAGQGFGSATGQYMDICIKFDTQTLSGYGLRIIRTPKNDRAVDFFLVKYEHGVIYPLTAPVSAVCFRKGCLIGLTLKGNRLSAHVKNTSLHVEPHRADLKSAVELTTVVRSNSFGGVSIQHTGSIGASATLLCGLRVNYTENENKRIASENKKQKQMENKVLIETSKGNIVVKLYDETPGHRDNFIKLVKEEFYEGTLFHRVIKNFMIQAGDPESKNAPADKMLGSGDTGYTLPAEFVYPKYFHKKGVLSAARLGDDVNPERNSSGCQFYIVTGQVYTPAQLRGMEGQMNQMRLKVAFDRLAGKHMKEIFMMRRSNDMEGLQRLQEKLIGQAQNEVATQPEVKFTSEQIEAYTTIGGTPHLDNQYTVFGEVLEGMDVVDLIQQVKTNRTDRPVDDVVILKMTVIE